jgi:hypothetical protein
MAAIESAVREGPEFPDPTKLAVAGLGG